MQTSHKEIFAIKFADCMTRLKNLGLVCEVAVIAGVVMISTQCAHSAKTIRRSSKMAANKCDAITCENRPSKGFYVFTIKV